MQKVVARHRSAPDGTRLLAAAACVLGAEALFATMGGAIRIAAGELDNAMIVFGRNLLGALLLLAWLLGRGGPERLRTAVPGLHLLRALFGTGAMYCFFYAIAHMPLAEAMLLKLTAPLFIPFVALAWLREPLPPWILPSLATGFAGVWLVLDPGGGDPDPVALVALAGGLLAAFAKVTVRRLSRHDPPSLIVFYFALGGLTLSVVPLPWYWHTPSPTAVAWLVLVGLLATAGQLLLSRGLSLAPAGRLAPFSFFSVVFGALLGWAFWDETLTAATLGGSLLILLSVLLAGLRTSAPARRSLPAESSP